MAKETASGVTFFLTLFFAARDFFNKVSSAGVFVSTLNAVEQLSMQLSSLLYTFPQFMRLSRYIENFRAVIEMPDTIEARFPGQIELAKKKNYKIEFRNVSFQYTGGDKWVLDDVSFTIESGAKAAIVGENGAGKTTLVKLLLRLYDPQKGGVYIDGVNITKIAPRSLRDAIAVVFQDVNIFSTTVRENITFDAGAAGTEDVLRSLRMVNLTEKIDAAEKGIDNPVSKLFDNGIVFSGGEEQRMAIARAFYRRQGILIMDEPSSALDPLAEYNLLQTMKQTMEGCTAMIISHRLSLCTMADKIYYLQDGRIREEGTHEQLLKTNGLYADAFNKQR
ncbi:MAG: ABC transporter ATP-binding protein/permease, partial [Treponema sp.]|nr:ABC transporter ATP-binding protein/permease [Treponema sp.]